MGRLPLENQAVDERLAWYLAAKFGLFIHWGAYSVAGVEASWPIMAPDLAEVMFRSTTRITEAEYRALPARFNPIDFSAQEWVRAAQDAGMRYIVITAKHHDGFCMFDAPGTDYKITNTPFGRDVCLELAEACAASGMRLGFYYSPPDMNHPGYRDVGRPASNNWLGQPKRREWAGYLDYMESHLTKLLSDYGDVAIIWFDGLVNHAKYDPPRFHRLIHELSPQTLTNDRLGDGYDFVTPEQFIPREGVPVKTGEPPAANSGGEGLFRAVQLLFKVPGVRGLIRSALNRYAQGELELTKIPQERCPGPDEFQPWETCMTMGQTWAYNPADVEWKSPRQLLHNLVQVASRGGNFLLNVGPTSQGTFPPAAVERLEHIGRWMAANGEAIHGASYTPLQALEFGRATQKGNRVFLHIFDWPSRGLLVVDDFPATAKSVSTLGGSEFQFRQDAVRLEIDLPAEALDPDVSVLVVHT
jgi:alpha-L-fucosidase